MLQNMYRTWCRSCTSEDFWVVVAEGQCANCHDLGNSTEPEVLGVPDLLHVPEALWCMPVGNTTVSFCTCSRGLSKDWGSRTTVLQLLHQLHLFQDPAVIKLRWFLDVITDCQCECSRAEQCHRPNAHLLDFKTSFNILDCVAAAKGQERLQMQRSSPLPPVWLAFDAVCTL